MDESTCQLPAGGAFVRDLKPLHTLLRSLASSLVIPRSLPWPSFNAEISENVFEICAMRIGVQHVECGSQIPFARSSARAHAFASSRLCQKADNEERFTHPSRRR